MKKYLLRFTDYDACELRGIFSSLEKLFDFYEKNRYTTLIDSHDCYKDAQVLEFEEDGALSSDGCVYKYAYTKRKISQSVSYCNSCVHYDDPHGDTYCSQCPYNIPNVNLVDSVWSDWEECK